jgi:P-type Ca2+ transporter type 2C
MLDHQLGRALERVVRRNHERRRRRGRTRHLLFQVAHACGGDEIEVGHDSPEGGRLRPTVGHDDAVHAVVGHRTSHRCERFVPTAREHSLVHDIADARRSHRPSFRCRRHDDLLAPFAGSLARRGDTDIGGGAESACVVGRSADRLARRCPSSRAAAPSAAMSRQPVTHAHAAEVAEVERRLQTDAAFGLSANEAARGLSRFGANAPSRPERPNYAAIAARQLADPIVGLLVAAVVVAAALGEQLEAVAIGLIVVLNATLGFWQESGAERAVIALRDRFRRTAAVIRDGRELEIPAEEVVPGDLLLVREGDGVAADARVVEAIGLEVDESMLTGESMPVAKHADPVAPDAVLGDRRSLLHAGTAVTRGRATALVVATGDATEAGRIAHLVASARPPQTPLQERLGATARILAAAGVLLTVALTAAMTLQGESLREAFFVGVSVAVAAVPEGLAATVTIALALGARAMADRGAIVSRLAAVETLGATTLVCTDKTGTLTENRLRVAAVEPGGTASAGDVLAAGALASSAELAEDGVRAAGDPVDAAIVLAALDAGVLERGSEGRTLVDEIPFDPVSRRMTRVYDGDGGERVAFSKGAPEMLLEEVADEAARGEADAAARRLAEAGLRVLAVTRSSGDAVEHVGLLALHDPLRGSAAGAVRGARAAGVGVKMLTGDHPETARAIAAELELAPDDVYARITPADKLAIVEELQAGGEVVAVTGDGVNDAPALRRADAGVAMGRSGTETAREAADIVLTDDDFATIVAAIREGRRIAENIRKFVAFLLSANLGEVALFAVGVLAGLGAPMTVVQVLLVNVLTDGLPAVALSRDPPSETAMERGPHSRMRLFGGLDWLSLAALGSLVGAAAFAAFLVGRAGGGDEQTMAFATVALAELALVFSCRSPREAAWRLPRNNYLLASVVFSAAVVALAVYLPALHEPLGTTALDPAEAALVLALAVVPTALAEAGKAGLRKIREKPNGGVGTTTMDRLSPGGRVLA